MVLPVVRFWCESCTLKKTERWRIGAFEPYFWSRFESPLDSKELQPVNHKGNEPWIFIGRTDAEAEAPVLWLPDAKSQFTGKDPNDRKDWRQKEKKVAEDEMVG